MQPLSILTVLVTVASVAAAPFNFPTPDGFPNITPATLAQIEHVAGGSLPNGQLPTSLKPTAVTVLQLLSVNELFEVAFFTELLANVTNNVPGYDVAPLDKAYVVKSLSAIVAQEKVHSIGVNAILATAGQAPIAPCQYTFPVSTFPEALLLAQTFTDIALGTLPDAQAAFAVDAGQEIPLITLVSSVLGQEGEQVGFFRYAQGKVPSAAPLLTGGSPSFAFTALQMFIVPGSCPKPLSDIPLTTFGTLNVVTKPEPKNMTLEYSVAGQVDCDQNAIVYLSGPLLPVTVRISDATFSGGVTHFKADFPFEAGFANGLTIAALVKGTGNFATNDAVAAATVYGPGLIEIN